MLQNNTIWVFFLILKIYVVKKKKKNIYKKFYFLYDIDILKPYLLFHILKV